MVQVSQAFQCFSSMLNSQHIITPSHGTVGPGQNQFMIETCPVPGRTRNDQRLRTHKYQCLQKFNCEIQLWILWCNILGKHKRIWFIGVANLVERRCWTRSYSTSSCCQRLSISESLESWLCSCNSFLWWSSCFLMKSSYEKIQENDVHSSHYLPSKVEW